MCSSIAKQMRVQLVPMVPITTPWRVALHLFKRRRVHKRKNMAIGVASQRTRSLFDVAGPGYGATGAGYSLLGGGDMARKPISVWIGQILIAVVGLIFAGFVVYFSVLQWPAIIRAAANNQTILLTAGAELVAKLAAIAFVAWTVVLISRRSPLGRWFGLLCLALLLAGSAYENLRPSSSPLALPYDNDAQRLGASVGQLIVIVAYLIFMMRFGFSRASKLYFAGVNAQEPAVEAGTR